MVQQSVVPSASGNIFRLQCAKSSMYTLFIIAVVVVRLLNARCVRFFVVVGDLTLPQHIPLSCIHEHCITRFMAFTGEWYHQVFTLQHTTVVYCFGSSDFSPLFSLSLPRSLCGHICCCKMLQTTNKLQQLSQLSTIMTTWLKGGEKRTSVLKLLAHWGLICFKAFNVWGFRPQIPAKGGGLNLRFPKNCM